ncbi:MAG: lipid A deacylase LpxR family protein [Chitinophagaceae bacterium]|nr:lipid A deacylase LpxR family protein [Chitinophagaceae bacterium]
MFLLIWIALFRFSYAQEKKLLRRELSFTTDNDAFLFKKKDAYYTNGFYVQYRFTDTTTKRKRLHAVEIGQMIFTPLSKKETIAEIDRPYCGYLFTRYSQTITDAHDGVFQWHGTLGVIGSASLAEKLQNEYHKLLGFLRFKGWEYQVRNAIGLDVGISYAFTALSFNDVFKIVPVTQGNIGTTFTNAKIGMVLAAGSFEKNNSSILFNTRINNGHSMPQKKTELFLYAYPTIAYQAYNATLQGGLLSKGSGAILAEPRPFVLEQRYGIAYAEERISTKLELIYQSKETDSQKRSQVYGSIQIGYRMF